MCNYFLVIQTWGGNGTYIDVLIKPNAVANVTEIFKKENVRYIVVIENLQKMIDEENPPLDENEAELQDRRGTYYFSSANDNVMKTFLSMYFIESFQTFIHVFY